jgi:hypothetical protein
MLAAHRNGGRTSLASFARAWDRYTRAGNGPRPATDRELRTLRTMLETSLALDEAGRDGELSRVAAEHRAAKRRRAARRGPRLRHRNLDQGERDRTSELRDRPGWAWLRPVKRYDAYERALDEVQDNGHGPDAERGRNGEPERERELERA